MAGLVPAIHAFLRWPKNVDARAFAAPKGLRPRRRDEPGMTEWGIWNWPYFGRTVGSPPGLPGGGMTGMLPSVLGAGACMSGSTPAGGQSTPSDLANLSPRGSRDWPVVVPSGAVARFGRSCGMQSAVCCGDGGAVRCGGVAGRGGACAIAALEAAITKLAKMMVDVVRMGGKRAGDERCSRRTCDVIGEIDPLSYPHRHCERSEAIQNPSAERLWIASLRSQ